MTFNGCLSTADSVAAAGSSRPITCTAKEDFWSERESLPVDERSSAALAGQVMA
jgi:hypothetical protein